MKESFENQIPQQELSPKEELQKEHQQLKELEQQYINKLEGLDQKDISEITMEELSFLEDLKNKIESRHKEMENKLFMLEWKKYSPRYLETVVEKENYKVKETLEGHDNSIYALQVLPDGTIVSGSCDNTIKIWKRNEDGKYQIEEILKGHIDSIYALQVLPDGTIVSGGWDNTIKIWRKDQTGKYQVEESLEGHNDSIYALQVLPDGTIVSGGWDNTIKIWDGQETLV